MKTVSSAGLTALASSTSAVPMALLVSMAFTTPLNLCTSNLNLVIGGTTYQGVAGMGKVGAVQNTPAEIKQLQFELSGVPPATVSMVAGGTAPAGTPVTVSVAIFNPATFAVTDVIQIWGGALDSLSLSDSAKGSTVTVTAEHVGIDLNRPSPLYYLDADQQTLFAGDLFFQYTSQQFDQLIIWPNAAFFRQ